MKKIKIVFIGDHSEKSTRDLLCAFCDRYADAYDVMVTGYNMDSLNNEPYRKQIKVNAMNSERYLLYKDTAEYVVCTSQMPRFIKGKSNQKLIYVLSDYNKSLFAGVIGDINTVISDNTDVINAFRYSYKHVETRYVENDDDQENNARQIVAAMEIADHPVKEPEDYMVVSFEEQDFRNHDSFALHRLFEEVLEESQNNVILFSNTVSSIRFSSIIAIDNTLRSISFLKWFDGTILFTTDNSRTLFNAFLTENNIKIRAKSEMLFQDASLLALERHAFNNSSGEDYDVEAEEYEKYRLLMDRLYSQLRCSEIKVSIIICRYNTPFDLLDRSIESALNCGHDNVEVILVDDGSEDIISDHIGDRFSTDKIKYFYKENEGLGLSRDYGVSKSTGKYVFYLDSDDTIHKDNLPCLIAHAEFFGLNLVIGKRMLCDENGLPYNESLKYLVSDTFTAYYAATDASVYADVMVNNKLILKDAILSNDIRFTKGLYEDIEYSTQMYSVFPEYHYVNVIIHDWYQYGENSTISSTIKLNNLRERIEKEESAWKLLPDNIKNKRILTIILSDFNLYLNSFFSFPEEERLDAWRMICDFFTSKKHDVLETNLPEKTRDLFKAMSSEDYDYFEYVISRYYSPKQAEEGNDIYIVFTHYHLFVSCLYAIKSKRESKIFINIDYVSFDTKLVYNLKKTGLFKDVVIFSDGSVVVDLINDLKQREEDASSIIPTHLYGKYKDIMRGCNPAKDDVFIFNDMKPYWYYVERDFENINKIEDAYNSFDREVKSFKLSGIWAGIEKYEGTYFPLMFYKSEKIKRIIVSKAIESIDIGYKKRIVVCDTEELTKNYYHQIKDCLLNIYSVDTTMFNSEATLLLTQPLSSVGYCTVDEQKELMAQMCKGISKENLLIKPHPADSIDYSFLGGTILPKSVPIEVYNFLDIKINSVISFASSANETIKFANKKKIFFPLHDFEFKDVENAIKDIIKTSKRRKAITEKEFAGKRHKRTKSFFRSMIK